MAAADFSLPSRDVCRESRVWSRADGRGRTNDERAWIVDRGEQQATAEQPASAALRTATTTQNSERIQHASSKKYDKKFSGRAACEGDACERREGRTLSASHVWPSQIDDLNLQAGHQASPCQPLAALGQADRFR